MKALLTTLKDEITTLFSTRLAWLLLGAGLGSAGDAKSVYDALVSLLGV